MIRGPQTAGVVVATDLAVGYPGEVVVSGIDLRLGAGRSLAVVGTNGSGKSTLLRTLVGLLPPLHGELEVLGHAAGRAPRRVAFLGQFHPNAMVLPLRVRAVVRMGRFANHGLTGRLGRVDEGLVDDAMERMGIAQLARRPLRDLSGGQRQRTYLAQVLARKADLLVLDEPGAGVDVGGREAYERELVAERARGATVVVATHDIAEASRADQAMLLAGRVVASGDPREVLTPERLLETFGVGLTRLGDELIVTEHPHGHDHV